MAGRGVDIILGGNPPKADETAAIKALGGLRVIGTERHEARRIDNQLRGRAGRQGDEGSSQFFMSLEDDLLRVFGGDRLKGMMEKMDIPEDMPIESRIVGKVIEQAQMKVEGFNFDARKHLLEYDDVLNKQRSAVYAKRETLLSERAPVQALYFLDMLWMSHLEDMESLRDSVRLRAYGQRDPLVEYRREAHLLYQQLLAQFEEWLTENKARLEAAAREAKEGASVVSPLAIPATPTVKQYEGTGRNDACPCGKKDAEGNPIKYKKCHGA
jgi:preprotein translocase subunit SecA